MIESTICMKGQITMLWLIFKSRKEVVFWCGDGDTTGK